MGLGIGRFAPEDRGRLTEGWGLGTPNIEHDWEKTTNLMLNVEGSGATLAMGSKHRQMKDHFGLMLYFKV